VLVVVQTVTLILVSIGIRHFVIDQLLIVDKYLKISVYIVYIFIYLYSMFLALQGNWGTHFKDFSNAFMWRRTARIGGVVVD